MQYRAAVQLRGPQLDEVDQELFDRAHVQVPLERSHGLVRAGLCQVVRESGSHRGAACTGGFAAASHAKYARNLVGAVSLAFSDTACTLLGSSVNVSPA